MNRIFIALIFLSAFCKTTIAQKDISVNGYVKNMQTVWFQDIDNNWTTWNTIQNRINLNWYANDNLRIHSGIRTLLNYGEIIESSNAYADMLKTDDGFVNMTKMWASGKSYTLHTNIDRAFIEYSNGDFQTTIGRQRINWGIGLVWNPNDIFNTFSYFDFDYEERPGSDAINIQYYTNMISSVQLVSQLDYNNNLKIAGKYKFNVSNYDIQLIGGYHNKEVIFGTGWAGSIKDAGFRGEISYFSSQKDTINNALIATIDADYLFKNQLYLHAAFLYNSDGTTNKAGRGSFLLQKNLSVRTLTLSKLDFFAQISYPITPLINADFSTIFNPYDYSTYFSPSFNISLQDNLSLLLITQIFCGEQGSEFGDYGAISYLRLKWNF